MLLKKIYLVSVLLILLNNLGFSQSIKWKEVKKINEEFFSRPNQVIKLRFCNKQRYIAEPDVRNRLFYFEKITKDAIDLAYIDSFMALRYKVQNDTFFSKRRDSVNFKVESDLKNELNWSKWIIPGSIYSINYLPIKNNKYIFDKHFNNGRLIYQSRNKDTSIILQKNRKSKLVRKIYLDEKLQIFLLKYENLDIENLQESWTIQLSVFQNSKLLHIADSFNYGPFRIHDYKPKVKENKIDSFKPQIFPLLNGEILNIDTTKVKYYIVDFWYISCYPCHLLRHKLEIIYKDADTSKFRFFGYNTSNKSSDLINFYNIKSYKIPEIDRTSNKLIQYKFNAHPTLLILDTNLKIVLKIVGYSEENINLIKKFLKEN